MSEHDTSQSDEFIDKWIGTQEEVTEGPGLERARGILSQLRSQRHGPPDDLRFHIVRDPSAYHYSTMSPRLATISASQSAHLSDGALAMTLALASMEITGIYEGFFETLLRRAPGFSDFPRLPFVIVIVIVSVGFLLSAFVTTIQWKFKALHMRLFGLQPELFSRSDERAARLCLRAGFDAEEIIEGLERLADAPTPSGKTLSKLYTARSNALREAHLDGSLHHYDIEDEDWLDAMR